MCKRGRCVLLGILLCLNLASAHLEVAGRREEKLLDSVLAFDGSNMYMIPEDSMPKGIFEQNGTAAESFFVSISVYLTEGPTGDHRLILFRGDDKSHVSVWLMPITNQVTFRIQGDGQRETFATSRSEIKLEGWTHLALTVGRRADSSNLHVMSLYMDGEIDSEIEMAEAQKLNPAGLVLGKVSGSARGMSGLVSQLLVGSHQLSSHGGANGAMTKFGKAMGVIGKMTWNHWADHTCESPNQALLPLLSSDLSEDEGLCFETVESDTASRRQPQQVNQDLYTSNWNLLRQVLNKDRMEEEELVRVYLELAWKNYAGVDRNPQSCDVGLHYMRQAAQIAQHMYQRPGSQYQMEEVLLSERIHHQRQDNLGTDADDSWALQSMAEGGSSSAALALGNRYFYGHTGFGKNMTAALKYFRKAHELGSDVGSIALAKMLLRGDTRDAGDAGVTHGAQAVSLYQGIIERSQNSLHISEAFNGLGYAHFYGKGTLEPNRTLALENFRKAAARGSSQGALNAALLLNDDGNKAEAYELFEMAAKDGNALANYYVGIFKASGEDGVERNCQEAFQSFWVMAKVGGPWSLELGEGLKSWLNGRTQDSFAHYLAGARMGYASAAYNLIYLLDHQRSRKNDPFAQVGEFLRKLRGDAPDRPSELPTAIAPKVLTNVILAGTDAGDSLRSWAHMRLGDCHLSGPDHGCEVVDEEKSMRHYLRALEGNPTDPSAYFLVGDSYFFGRGVEKNASEAFRLFGKGRAQTGNDLASLLAVWTYTAASLLEKVLPFG